MTERPSASHSDGHGPCMSHRRRHGPGPSRRRVRVWRMAARLRRSIFLSLGVTIVLTGIVVAAVMALGHRSEPGYWEQVEGVQRLVGMQFADRWHDGAARGQLAEDIAAELGVAVLIMDADDRVLGRHGPLCGEIGHRIEVPPPRSPVAQRDHGDSAVGSIAICRPANHGLGAWALPIGLLAAGLVLWGGAGRLSRRLAQPLVEVERVARAIGDGHLDARISDAAIGDVGVLGAAINDMAARIEKQLGEQRALLATVSHEVRTPLSRIRVMLDLARDATSGDENVGGPGGADYWDEIEREILEVDALIDKVLASSRLDFAQVSPRLLDAEQTARRALERVGMDRSLLTVTAIERAFTADPTLLARALANLIENARRHGGGLESLVVFEDGDGVHFEVRDRGPGFTAATLDQAFDSFFRGDRRSEGLGLGLALVDRIARAHGGRGYAVNREGGGAAVGIVLPRQGAASSPKDGGVAPAAAEDRAAGR